MVRVGGGWDTLENYLNKHDPCRCAPEQGNLKGNYFLHREIVSSVFTDTFSNKQVFSKIEIFLKD
jgi:hypothetical protein